MESLLRLNLLVRILVFGIVPELQRLVKGDGGLQPCNFPAVYNFGYANSDTDDQLPVEKPFFGYPAGRYCDGRLIIDIIAESLKLPYLSAYLDSIGTKFQHGANMLPAVHPTGHLVIVPLILELSFLSSFNSKLGPLLSISSSLKVFHQARSMRTIDIGQNDLSHGFQVSTERQVQESIPDILTCLSQVVGQLYDEGARFFWVHNTSPVGCLPYAYISYQVKSAGNKDQNGCVKPQNDVAKEFIRQLKNKFSFLRTQLPHAEFTYVDFYSAKYSLIRFVDPLNFCSGIYNDGFHLGCGKKAMLNGRAVYAYGNACNHPSRHISWDEIHYTEAANRWIANQILKGSFSDPPLSIQHACHLF